ncbi:MAG: hypothetical protein V7776_02435 [Halopseudomonas aestusnigri]
MSIQSNTDQAEQSIAIGEAISEAFSPLFSNFKTAIKFTLLPSISLIVMMGIGIYFISMIAPNSATIEQEISPLFFIGQLFFFLLGYLIFCQFYAAWVRFIFLGENSATETFLLKLNKRHLLLTGKGLLLGIGSYIVFIIVIAIFILAAALIFFGGEVLSLQFDNYSPSAIGGMIFLIFPIMLFVMAFFTAIVLKLSYVFPATALDEPYSFSMSWAHTKTQGFKIFISFFVLYLIISFAAGILMTILGGIFSVVLFTSGDIFQAENPADILTSTSTILLVVPLYFGVMIFSLLAMIPFINMHNYCFATNTGWQSSKEITERFS